MGDDRIRLTLPADPEYGRVARTAAAGLALRLGFSYGEIEDLRLAIDEVLILLLRPSAESDQVTLVFEPTEEGLVLDASTGQTPTDWPDEEACNRFEYLVDPVVDAWEVDEDQGRVHLVKHKTS